MRKSVNLSVVPSNSHISLTEVRGGNGPTTIVTERGVTVLECDEDEGEGLKSEGLEAAMSEARAVEDSTTRLGVSTTMTRFDTGGCRHCGTGSGMGARREMGRQQW